MALGVAFIGWQQYGHIQDREKRSIQEAQRHDPEALVIGHWHVTFLKTIPFRAMSRWWGHWTTAYDLPTWLRSPVYQLWTWAFGCNLDEMDANDLRDYRNLNAFFTRTLKEGVRPIAHAPVVRAWLVISPFPSPMHDDLLPLLVMMLE